MMTPTGATKFLPCVNVSIIRYSKKDTAITKDAVRDFNAAYDAACS